MKKYFLLLLIPLFTLSCSSDNDDVETLEDRIKKNIVESYGIEKLIEFNPVKEVGRYEDSKMYKYVISEDVSGTIDDHVLTREELIEYYRVQHTEVMYNCFVKWKAEGYYLSYTFCVNSSGKIFAFDFKTLKVN